MFTLARFLRDKGYNAELLLLDEPEHFHPKADSFSDDYINFTKQLNWMPSDFWGDKVKTPVTKASIRNDLAKYEIIIACGYAPAFINFAGRKLDIFIPYGSDFYYVPFIDVGKQDNPLFPDHYPIFQRRAIESARHIIYDVFIMQEPVLNKIKLQGKRHLFFPPVFYTPHFNQESIKVCFGDSSIYNTIIDLRAKNDLLVIQHCRQSWKNPPDQFSNKGNDILIYSFKELIEKYPQWKIKLLLFEYGDDVTATKNLIQDLNLQDHIFWFKKLNRKDIFIIIHFCDIGVGELGISWFLYGVVCEYMAMKKPFIHFCEVKSYKTNYPETYPVLNASQKGEIVKILEDCLLNRRKYVEIGSEGFNWFMKYIILGLLFAIYTGMPFADELKIGNDDVQAR